MNQAWAPADQMLPYGGLSLDNKDLDRLVVLEAVRYLQSQGIAIRAVNLGWQIQEHQEDRMQRIVALLTTNENSAAQGTQDLASLQSEFAALTMQRSWRDIIMHETFPYGYLPEGIELYGTEGARRELPTSAPGGEDRYGLLDGESCADRDRRHAREGAPAIHES